MLVGKLFEAGPDTWYRRRIFTSRVCVTPYNTWALCWLIQLAVLAY